MLIEKATLDQVTVPVLISRHEIQVNGTATSATLTLLKGMEYQLTVRALNGAGSSEGCEQLFIPAHESKAILSHITCNLRVILVKVNSD